MRPVRDRQPSIIRIEHLIGGSHNEAHPNSIIIKLFQFRWNSPLSSPKYKVLWKNFLGFWVLDQLELAAIALVPKQLSPHP